MEFSISDLFDKMKNISDSIIRVYHKSKIDVSAEYENKYKDIIINEGDVEIYNY